MRTFIGVVALTLVSCVSGHRVEPATTQVAPTSIALTCDGSRTGISQSEVQAQPDGVHIEVRNTTDERMLVSWAGGGDDVGPGRTALVFTLPPGSARLRCLHGPHTMVDAGAWRSFEVLPTPRWVSPDLACRGTWEVGTYDYVPGAAGVTDPFADARSRVPGAVVVEAGYHTDETHTILVLKDGVATQLFSYHAAHGGTQWLLGGVKSCST